MDDFQRADAWWAGGTLAVVALVLVTLGVIAYVVLQRLQEYLWDRQRDGDRGRRGASDGHDD